MPRKEQGDGFSGSSAGSGQPGRPAPREVFEVALGALLSLDSRGRVLYANPRAEELFGFASGEMAGVSFTDELVPEAQRELVREAVQSLVASGQERQVQWRLDVPVLRRDGRELP